MQILRSPRLLISSLILFLLGGCATEGPWYTDWRNCAMAGAAVVGGAVAADDKDSALGAAAGGAIVSGLICAAIDTTPPDSDGDGVTDDKDQCPATPMGAKVDAVGCELDSDGDGVVDRLDQCPNTPRGTQVDRYGCPVKKAPPPAPVVMDSDEDGVPDDRDFCPDTEKGVVVNVIGCDSTKPTLLRGVNFEYDSAEIKGESYAILDDAADRLRLFPEVKVEIVGYTDSIGSEVYNQGLSERRAESVRYYLVSKGVKDDNIKAIGLGEQYPIADNATAAGRAENRRIEIRVAN
ncbi:OmpA family protein [Aestuariirhabdus litorea]|uniref:OmpA family protein n=1 Tax=Aestuariirhabdus litorea TaxID=2528527 RepID=A0A3P3VI27_9GAMM|nr:OmpA family protein [Aestuariirhabdus litorea]RRJ82381.1 OmpA family protein [Aestuariirhabdus litorea]RWW92544.1 OmpA family protein [Endozoicomonadaceae bacterium GTF-13]